MRKDSALKKINKICIIVIVLFLLTSCIFSRKTRMHAHVNRYFDIISLKDTISIKITDNGQEINDKYYLHDGEYFNVKDSQLFLSTKRETEFNFLIGFYEYKIKIEKYGENFKTMIFLISPELGTIFLSAFYYDKNYKIYRIEKSQMVEFY